MAFQKPSRARGAAAVVDSQFPRRRPANSLSRVTRLAASLLVLSLLTGACSRITHKKPLTEIERREIDSRVQKALETAGGLDVWVKGPDSKQHVEVLATRAGYDRLLAAFREEARKENLRWRELPLGSNSGLRAASFRLTKGGVVLGQWDCREVERLRRAAIVIDDLGQDLDAARELLRSGFSLTFSILPGLRYSAETAEEAHRAGRVVILHLPMEPEPGSGARPGPGAIDVGMSQATVARKIQQDFDSVPFAMGANNHMGSRATADAPLMLEVMKVLVERRMFFIDSRTTAATTALDAARRLGVPSFYRSVFLDDTETTAYTLGQLSEFRRIVEEQGVALAIGHPHPTTLAALAEFLPTLEADDIQLVPASELVRLPEAAKLSPPPAPPKLSNVAVSGRR